MAVGKSVLVIDDEPLCRRVLLSLVHEFTVGQLHEACDGKQGVQAYQTLRPDIVLLDIDMPGMDGMTALEQIREFDPHANVVIVSAQCTKQRVLQAMKLGARHFIRKDTPRDRLRLMIKRLLGVVEPTVLYAHAS